MHDPEIGSPPGTPASPVEEGSAAPLVRSTASTKHARPAGSRRFHSGRRPPAVPAAPRRLQARSHSPVRVEAQPCRGARPRHRLANTPLAIPCRPSPEDPCRLCRRHPRSPFLSDVCQDDAQPSSSTCARKPHLDLAPSSTRPCPRPARNGNAAPAPARPSGMSAPQLNASEIRPGQRLGHRNPGRLALHPSTGKIMHRPCTRLVRRVRRTVSAPAWRKAQWHRHPAASALERIAPPASAANRRVARQRPVDRGCNPPPRCHSSSPHLARPANRPASAQARRPHAPPRSR